MNAEDELMKMLKTLTTLERNRRNHGVDYALVIGFKNAWDDANKLIKQIEGKREKTQSK